MTHLTFASECQTELHSILAWWQQHMTDHENGGFFGRIDGFGTLHPEAEKGAVLNARILWIFSAAARSVGVTLSHPDTQAYAKTAECAYNYLIENFLDKKHGGVFWSLDHLGQPLHTKKQVYAQAFAVYGLSEYFLLTRDAAALEYALDIFDLLEKHALDRTPISHIEGVTQSHPLTTPHIRNGYYEAYSRDWQLLDDLRLSDKDANEAKTQNTHLHLLEAYANLLRALLVRRKVFPGGALPEKLSGVQAALENLIHLFLEKFIDPATGHIHLFFDENWQLKSDIVSFGHDIEASWLLWDAVQTLEAVSSEEGAVSSEEGAVSSEEGAVSSEEGAVRSEEVRPICLHIAEATLREAVEPDGSVINQRWNADGRLDRDRIWWVQAEAMVGFWNAFQVSGDERFRQAALDCWRFTQKNMRDGVGEWLWRISPTGENYPEEDKAGFWKCPYHNGRAMLFLSQTSGYLWNTWR